MSKYSDFFNQIGLFRKKQNAQKQRGLNDYNLLTTVLSPYDEVKLHSRVIHSLLAPQGLHYQGSLFLELFFKVTGFDNFNCQGACVAKEYEQIDLYLTDNKKHIIIENKVQARDQENQIERYLEVIREKNVTATCDDILVIYLSIDRREPSEYSLGGLIISDGYLIEGKSKKKLSRYKSIHYKNEILDWLRTCRYEIQNISNLNESINQYISVVKSINNINTHKIMQLPDYLKDNLDDEHVEIIEEILNTFRGQGREKIVKNFFEYFKRTKVEKIKKECHLDDNWVVRVDTKKMGRKNWRAFRIGREHWYDQAYYIEYGWEVEQPQKGDSYYGILFKPGIDQIVDIDFSIIYENKELSMSTFTHEDSYPLWAESYNPQSVKALVEFCCNKDNAAEKIANEMIDLIKHTKHDVEKINHQLMIREEGSE